METVKMVDEMSRLSPSLPATMEGFNFSVYNSVFVSFICPPFSHCAMSSLALACWWGKNADPYMLLTERTRARTKGKKESGPREAV